MAELRIPDKSRAWIPFTESEVDSLEALRNQEYDRRGKQNGEESLIRLAELASDVLAFTPSVFKAATRPIVDGSSRLSRYFAGDKLLPVTGRRVVKYPIADSEQEAAEKFLTADAGAHDVLRSKRKYVPFGPQPMRRYTYPEGKLEFVRPGPAKKFPTDDYVVTFDTGVDRVRPDFESMAKPTSKRSNYSPLSVEYFLKE